MGGRKIIIMEKPTLILLHGWNQNKNVWFSIENKFSKDYSVISLDFPGFGEEAKPSENWGIPEYSTWLIDIIKKKNLKNVILIGHSFGGRITAYTASKNPSWLKAIVLSGTPGLYRPNKLARIKIFFIKTFKNITPRIIKNLFLSEEDLNARKNGMKIIRYKAITFDQTSFLPKIVIPTLIINGGKDDNSPVEIAKEMNTLIPNSQLVVLENLKHNTFIENDNLFYGKIKNFIENL